MIGKRLLLSGLVFTSLLGATGQIHADTTSTSTAYSRAVDAMDGYATYESKELLYNALDTPLAISNHWNADGKYTKTTYAKLDKAVQYALKINNKYGPSQEEVDNAYAKLIQAQNNLQEFKGSKEQKAAKDKLLKIIRKAKSKTNKGYPKYRKLKITEKDQDHKISGGRYNYFMFKAMQKIIKNASKVYKDPNANLASINNVNKRLNKSLSGLVDHSAYYKVEKIFNSLNRYDYTVPSFCVLNDEKYFVFNSYNTTWASKNRFDIDLKDFYSALHKLKKHHWRKDTNKLWGKVNKKTGKFYYNKDAWGRTVKEYEYKDKAHKKPSAYYITRYKNNKTYTTYYDLNSKEISYWVE